MIIIAAVAYGGYVFVPVAYQAYLFKDLMQHDVDVAATQGYKPSWVGEQLTKSLPEYEIPQDAIITPTQLDNRIAVRFQYEWRDDSDHWFRSYGNEQWEFDGNGLMRRREASINDVPIASGQRKFLWPAGPRPAHHPGLTELGM